MGGHPISGLGRGTPSQVWMVGVPGVPPNQVWMVGEYPGYPLDQVWMVGGTPSQVWMVGGTPSQVWMVGVPYPRSGWWRVPRVTPPDQVWIVGGTPPPIRQSSIASTCYAAGGVPLAFTQVDFLVCSKF